MGTREYIGGIEDELLSPNTMKHQKNSNTVSTRFGKDRHSETGFAFLSELLFLPSKKYLFCHDPCLMSQAQSTHARWFSEFAHYGL
jgi:hypothetical protein